MNSIAARSKPGAIEEALGIVESAGLAGWIGAREPAKPPEEEPFVQGLRS
ncbi:MAG: hypothetical protein LBT47_00725 [Deltaproteobacteria bacterium]|nr:hypothetical protein [Deltaproteobacteria bacterium]